jgi:excisionase family DNA binding protein
MPHDERLPSRLTYREAEVATMLGVDRSTVSRWVASGRLKHVRINGVRLIRPRDVEAFLDEHTEGGGAVPKHARARRPKQ